MDQDYRVELDAYNGPLDLLLFLVRRHEIDLHDIPIAELTDQYLHHLELIKQIDVNSAGEFLVMAATLLEIKSAMLMPRQEVAEGDDQTGEQLDPRYELVQQLLAYKRFKDAALDLDERREQWQARYPRRPVRLSADGSFALDGDEGGAEMVELDFEDVHVLDLCEAFARMLDSIGQGPTRHEVVYDDTPIALHAEDILDRLKRDAPLTLQIIFIGRRTRSEMIGLFLALLELVRQRKVRVAQEGLDGQIRIEPRSEAASDAGADPDGPDRDWRDPETGQIRYEWPSEEARQRAERRAERRLARLKNRQFGDDQQQEDDIVIVDGDDEPEAPAQEEPNES